MKWKIGDRVRFSYRGEPPFSGEEIHGELVMQDGTYERWAVYRDEKWRIADAACTWVDVSDLEAE